MYVKYTHTNESVIECMLVYECINYSLVHITYVVCQRL